MEQIILLSYIPLGIIGIFRPLLLLHLFLTLPLFEYVPEAFGDFSTLRLFQIGSINVFLWDYLMFMLAIFLLRNIVKKNPRFFITLNSPVSSVVILVFVWEIFIGVLSYSKGFELQNILRNLSRESLLFIAIFIPLIDGFEEKKEKFLQFTVVLSLLAILFAILKYGVFHEVELTSSATQRTLTGNAVVILMFPLCYVIYYSKFWREHSWLSLFYIFLVAVGVHFAGHRSGWIAFLFIIGLWFIFQRHKIRLAWVPLWSVSLAVVLVLFAISVDLKSGTAFGDFFIRVADTVDLSNSTTQERLSKWQYSFDKMSENPFLGLGRFPVYTKHIDEENTFLADAFSELNRAPHNLIANKAIHEGLLGLGVLALFFFVIFKQLEKAPPEDKAYYDFLKVFVMAFLIYSLFNPVFSAETGRTYLFTALGLLNANMVRHALEGFLKNLKYSGAIPSAG